MCLKHLNTSCKDCWEKNECLAKSELLYTYNKVHCNSNNTKIELSKIII